MLQGLLCFGSRKGIRSEAQPSISFTINYQDYQPDACILKINTLCTVLSIFACKSPTFPNEFLVKIFVQKVYTLLRVAIRIWWIVRAGRSAYTCTSVCIVSLCRKKMKLTKANLLILLCVNSLFHIMPRAAQFYFPN